MKASIEKLGDEDSYLTSYDKKYSSGNSHLKFHNNPESLTGPKKFKPDPEDYIKIPVVTTPADVVLQQAFKERNRKVIFKRIQTKSIHIGLRKFILLEIQSTMDLFCNPNLVGKFIGPRKYAPSE